MNNSPNKISFTVTLSTKELKEEIKYCVHDAGEVDLSSKPRDKKLAAAKKELVKKFFDDIINDKKTAAALAKYTQHYLDNSNVLYEFAAEELSEKIFNSNYMEMLEEFMDKEFGEEAEARKEREIANALAILKKHNRLPK